MHPLFPGDQDPVQICVAGDWHGNTAWAVSQLERIRGRARVILHVGDWGLRRESPSMIKYVSLQQKQLTAIDAFLVVTPGNHEDWFRLATMPADPSTGLQKLTNRIWFAPRGFRWQWADKTWLSVGGAVSVDRDRRTEGRDWWPAEAIDDADVERAVDGGVADVMITHDAPAAAYVPGLPSDQWPADAITDSNEHRARLQAIVDACRPQHLWHGHMHVRYSDRIELGLRGDRPEWDGLLTVHGLDGDQGQWRNNMAFVDCDGSPIPWDSEDATGQPGPTVRP